MGWWWSWALVWECWPGLAARAWLSMRGPCRSVQPWELARGSCKPVHIFHVILTGLRPHSDGGRCLGVALALPAALTVQTQRGFVYLVLLRNGGSPVHACAFRRGLSIALGRRSCGVAGS